MATSSSSFDPSLQPYRGIDDLKSNLRSLRPSTDAAAVPTIDAAELRRLAGLAYLDLPQTEEQLQAINAKLATIVSWLAQITHVEPVSTTPLVSPLQVLLQYVPPGAVETSVAVPDAAQSPDGSSATAFPSVRLRADVPSEGEQAAVLLGLAQNKDRGFYVVPANGAHAEE